MALAVYDAIRDFYGGQQLPANDSGVFFGFTGCTRSALERAAENLRANRGAWLGVDAATRSATFSSVASLTAAETGADIDGVIKFCNWCFVAANGDTDIKNWFNGGDFSRLDYWKKTVTETATSAAQQAAETIEYGIKYQGEPEKTLLNRVFPVVLVLGACYIVKKVLD